MNHKLILSSALASVLAVGLSAPVLAHAEDSTGKEKCYGIAKAGENSCANLSGSHACASEAKVDYSPEEWKFVAKGTCKDLKGMTAAEARAKLKDKKG